MCLEFAELRKTGRTMFARVQLSGGGVSTDVFLQLTAGLKQLAAVATFTGRRRSGVHATCVGPQVRRPVEPFVTRRTLVPLVRRRVDSDVSAQISRHTEGPVTLATFERFLAAVRSVAVTAELRRSCKPSAAVAALKRPFPGMTSPMNRQRTIVTEPLSTLTARVLAAVNVHVLG